MLRLYHDPEGVEEVTEQNPDHFRKAVTEGGTLEDITELYLLTDDAGLTYENVSIQAVGDEDDAEDSGEIDISYSLDGVTFDDPLDLPDGDYAEARKIYRKAVAPNVESAFKRTDIMHEWKFDEYVK